MQYLCLMHDWFWIMFTMLECTCLLVICLLFSCLLPLELDAAHVLFSWSRSYPSCTSYQSMYRFTAAMHADMHQSRKGGMFETSTGRDMHVMAMTRTIYNEDGNHDHGDTMTLMMSATRVCDGHIFYFIWCTQPQHVVGRPDTDWGVHMSCMCVGKVILSHTVRGVSLAMESLSSPCSCDMI